MSDVYYTPEGIPRITIKPPAPPSGGELGPFVPAKEEPAPTAAQEAGFGPFTPATEKAAAVPTEPAKAPPEPKTTPTQQMLIDFQNQQLAASQRTTPIVAAHTPFLLGPAQVNDAGEIGYLGPGNQFVPMDANQHVWLTDPNDAVPKVYLRNELTNEGAAASIGRFLAPGMGAGNIQFGGAAAPMAAAEAARRLGVNVPRAITSPSPTVQFLGQTSAEMPGGAALTRAVPAAREGLAEATQAGAAMTGGTPSAVGAGEGFSTAVQSAIKPGPGQPRPVSGLGRAAQGVSDAYSGLDQIMDPTVHSPLAQTAAVANDIMSRRAAFDTTSGPGKAVGTVLEGATRPGGLTFSAIKDLRTSLGELLKGGVFPEGMSEAELRRIYGALSEDLRTAAGNAGGAQGLEAFNRANRLAALLADWEERLKGILGTRGGEGIYAAIIRMASARPGSSDLRNLIIARRSVPVGVWKDIAATAISELGRAPGQEWSPARFLSDFRKLSPQGRNILFSGLDPALLRHLDDLAEVSAKFVEAGRLANVSHTSGHVTTPIAILAAAEGIGRGSLVEPLAAIGGLVGNTIMAKILAAPASVSSLARWLGGYARAIERGPAALPLLRRITGDLVNTVNSQQGTSLTVNDVLGAIWGGPGSQEYRAQQQRQQ